MEVTSSGAETCANCNNPFVIDIVGNPSSSNTDGDGGGDNFGSRSNSDQVKEFLACFSDCERTVSLFEALNSVFTLNPNKIYRRQIKMNVNEFKYNSSVVMCTKCAEIVASLYKNYVELMELSAANGMLAKVLRQAHLWHMRQGMYEEDQLQGSTSVTSKDCHQEGVDVTRVKFERMPGELAETETEEEADDYDEFENGVNSLLAVDFTEGQPDDLVNPNSMTVHQHETIRTVPKKRKIVTEDFDENDATSTLLKTNRRKNANPIKHSLPSTTVSDDASNVRRSERIVALANSIFEQRSKASLKTRKKKKLKRIAGTIRYIKPKSHKKKKRTAIIPRSVKTSENVEAEGDEEPEYSVPALSLPRSLRKRHRRVAYNPAQIPCEQCDQCFPYQWMVNHHILSVHKGQKPKECEECGLLCYDDDVYKSHVCIPKAIQESDKTFKPYKCKYCGKMLINRGNFTRHCAAHDSDAVLCCPYPDCKLTFKIAENLAKHEKVHGQEPPSWQCSICGKVFKVKRRMVEHMDIHLEEKKYLCTQCGVRFAQHKALVRHTRVHENNLRYKCPLCGKGFKRRDNVTQHLNSKVHPRELVASIRMQGISAVDTARASANSSSLSISETPDQDTSETPEVEPKSEKENDSQTFVVPPPPGNGMQVPVSEYSGQPNMVPPHHSSEFQYSDLLHL